MIAVVVFDLDGTLVDSNAIKRKGFFDVVAGHCNGVERMTDALEKGGDRHTVFVNYVAAMRHAGVMHHDADSLTEAYSRQIDAAVAQAPEIEGAASLIRELREHKRHVGVASATPAANLHAVLQARGWIDWFDGVFGYPVSKQEALLKLAESLRMPLTSMAMVGDGADDRESAARAGCSFFPVGEARGTPQGERVFTLTELTSVLLNS